MATESISLKTWAWYSGGWYPTNGYVSADDAGSSTIGAGVSIINGQSNQRVVFPIEIPEISGLDTDKTLKVTITFRRQDSSNSNAVVLARLRTAGHASNYNEQGEEVAQEEQTIQFGSGSDFNKPITATFSFDISGRTNSGETLYLWIMGASTTKSVFNVQKGTTCHTASLEYVTYSKPTSPSITTASTIYKPTDSITINWSGGSSSSTVSISSYTLKIRKASSSGTVLYTLTGISPSKTSQKVQISDFSTAPTRGDTLYATIQAIGSVSGYNGATNSNKIGSINRLPGAPTYKASGTTLNTANKITYTVTAGSDNDSQTLTLYYSLNSGTKTKFTSPLEITTSTEGIRSGSNSIVFYTYDTKEYSSASSSHSFTATFQPVIGNITITHTEVQDMNGSTSTGLASAAKIEFTMTSGTPSSVKLYVRTGSSSSLSGNGTQLTSGFTYNQETKTITIPNIFAISSITAGYYYQFAFKINDGTTDSNLSDWTKCAVKRKPRLPRLPSDVSCNRHVDSSKGATAKEGYYKDKVTINYTNPSATAGYAKISSLVITATYGSSSKDYACTLTAGTSTSSILDLSQVNANVSTSFVFKITDAAGQTATSSTLFTLTKSSPLAFGGTEVNVTNENLKPLTNTESFQISHPIAQASGTSNIVYKYNIKVGDNTGEITTYTNEVTTDQVIITITAANINAKVLELAANQTSAFDTIITVTAADGFADTVSLPSGTFKVNFTEPPYFIATNPQFRIKHDYYTNNTTATPSMGTEITSSSDLNLRMINSGEGIVFVLPRAADPNGDIKEYQIYLARNDFTGTVQSSDAVEYNQLLISISYDNILKNGPSDSDYYYYRYTASTYTKNEYFYFKVRVVDSTGNVSNDLICPNYLIGCRTVAPTFSAGNVQIDRNGTNVTLNYNFIVTDLGGSATKDGWTKSFYDSYPNFERSITNYTPKATLLIEIAPSQDFKDDETISNRNNLIVFTPTSQQKLYNFTSQQIRLTGFSESHAKIFVKFTLTVSYGLQSSSGTLATITSIPQVYSYFGSVPTVAHRAHKVGINTISLEQDDVFVVENYQGTKYVVFKGTDPSNAASSYEVRIDLLEGKIYGYKTQGENRTPFLRIESATIDGGSW